MKKKLRRNITIGISVVAVALPASVYASLQPINLGQLNEQIPTDNGPMNEQIPVDLGSIGEESLSNNGQQNSYPLNSNAPSIQVTPTISVSGEIFRSINTGNIRGAINRILGILGQLGLLNPADESARVSTDPGNPYSNPQTPEQVYESQRHTDIVRSQIPQNLSQIVFGVRGQQALSQQARVVESAQKASKAGQQGVATTYQESVFQARQNVNSAKIVAVRAKKAQSSNVSQDVMKAIAAQNEDLAKIGSGNSTQLAHLGKAASYQSAQLSAANTQLAFLNDKTQSIEVLSASQNYQSAQINAAIERINHYQQLKDSLQQNANHQSSSLIYIPGLVPKGNVQGEAR